jgi:hypothetical protein
MNNVQCPIARAPVYLPARADRYNVSMAATPRCVYCRQRPIDDRWRPFCSERCKLADLGRWLRGEYRVPAAPAPDALEDDDGEAADES